MIDEEIYVIGEELGVQNEEIEAVGKKEESGKLAVEGEEPQVVSYKLQAEETTVEQVVESTPKELVEEEAGGEKADQVEKTEATKTQQDRDYHTPDIPTQIERVRFAFFHNTDQPEEIDLLSKIVAACKLEASSFKVLKVGEEVTFEKAVVFTKSGPSYYVPNNHERGIVMYSQPLHALLNSKEEKGKLWGALQVFVK